MTVRMRPAKPDKIPSIKSVMTPFPWLVHIEDRLGRAAEMMAERNIRHLPVTEDGKLVGVLADRDLQLVMGAAASPEQRASLTVRDACVADAYVVETSEPLNRVLLTMASRHIDSALVVKNGKLAGIFTLTDACRCFGEFLESLFPEIGDDIA
jgi:CBS domain-containing protein